MQQQLLPALIAAGVALVAVSWLVPHAPVQLVHARYALQHRRRYKREAALVSDGGNAALGTARASAQFPLRRSGSTTAFGCSRKVEILVGCELCLVSH
jgi:hypothetical protein